MIHLLDDTLVGGNYRHFFVEGLEGSRGAGEHLQHELCEIRECERFTPRRLSCRGETTAFFFVGHEGSRGAGEHQQQDLCEIRECEHLTSSLTLLYG